MAQPATVSLSGRLVGAPISWGVCEVPGWGATLDPETVFSEMAALGLTGTELGPVGYLPADPAELRRALARHGLSPVAAFVPVVFDPGLAPEALAPPSTPPTRSPPRAAGCWWSRRSPTRLERRRPSAEELEALARGPRAIWTGGSASGACEWRCTRTSAR